ncbi:MAG: tetratricopeptide repeat protein [Nitrospirota bacterium]|nr:MAG: tetratricopeptide repeat protein [Nitrospirota bacterium]
MPHIFAAKYVLVIPVLIYLLVSAGCGKPSHRQDKSEDLDRQAQEQILRKARVDFDKGRDAEVIKDLERFLSDYSRSPREREARRLLAQSYERSGKFQAALKQYKILSQKLSPGQEKKEVAKRIDELEQRLTKVRTESEPTKVVRTSLSQVYPVANDPPTLKRLVQEGVTGVLIDFGCPAKAGQQPMTAVKTSDVSTQSQLPLSVAQIHRHGLLVFVGINLRCLGYLDSRSKKQWLDGSYNPVSRKVQLSPYFDIFHPQYQKLMAYEIKRLTDLGIDGVVFLAEVPLGRYDGFTPGSVNTFNKTFHTNMNPHTLFENGANKRNSQFSPDGNQYAEGSMSEISEFWRWAGWKARQRLTIMQGLMDQVHEQKPGLPFGLELHPESIVDPLGALTQYSEDFLEAKQKSFMFFLVTPQAGRNIQLQHSPANSIDPEDFFKQSRTMVDRMTLVLQNPARIWLSIPWGKKTTLTLVSASHKARHLEKVSQSYDLQTFLDK